MRVGDLELGRRDWVGSMIIRGDVILVVLLEMVVWSRNLGMHYYEMIWKHLPNDKYNYHK